MCVELVPLSANFHTGESQLVVLVGGCVWVVVVSAATPLQSWALPWEHVSLARIAQVVCCLCFLSGSSVVKDLAVRIREPDRDYTGDILV